MRVGVAQGGLSSLILFSLYINDMPPPSHHVELAIYADDTAIIATSRKQTLLVSYLESYLDLQQWLSDWRIAINVSKGTALIFARAGRRFIQLRPVTLFWEPIQWVDTTRYLGGDPRYTTHLVASHRPSQEEDSSKDGSAGSPPQ